MTLNYEEGDPEELWDIVSHLPDDERFQNNALRFYEAAYTKMDHAAVAELGEKVAANHPNKTYVRDTIGCLLMAGMEKEAIAGSLRLIFL